MEAAIPLRAVLRAPHFTPTFLAAMLGRIPMGAIGLLFVLRTEDLTGSYAHGGLAAGVLSLALAASAPLVGRQADSRGHVPVLVACAAVVAAALLAFAALPAGAPLWAILACAAAAGAANPPLGAAMRVSWGHVLPDDGHRHAAYAFDAAMTELTYILGPLVLVALVATRSTAAALALAATMMVAGTGAFVASSAVRGRAPAAGERPRGGALAVPGIRTLAAAFTLGAAGLGTVEVAVAATLEALDARATTGLALALWGVGSLLGGLAYARRRPPARLARALVALFALVAVTQLPLLAAGSPAALCALLVPAGVALSPTIALTYRLVDRLAPPGAQIEAFMWIATGLGVGIAAGAPLAGLLAEHADPSLGFALAAATSLAAAGLILARRRTLD